MGFSSFCLWVFLLFAVYKLLSLSLTLYYVKCKINKEVAKLVYKLLLYCQFVLVSMITLVLFSSVLQLLTTYIWDYFIVTSTNYLKDVLANP